MQWFSWRTCTVRAAGANLKCRRHELLGAGLSIEAGSQRKFKNSGERFDWSTDRVAFGKPVMWLAVKTCAAVGYVNWGCKVNDKQCVSVSC